MEHHSLRSPAPPHMKTPARVFMWLLVSTCEYPLRQKGGAERVVGVANMAEDTTTWCGVVALEGKLRGWGLRWCEAPVWGPSYLPSCIEWARCYVENCVYLCVAKRVMSPCRMCWSNFICVFLCGWAHTRTWRLASTIQGRQNNPGASN